MCAFCLKDLEQILQTKGFSPVWILRCCLKLNRLLLMRRPHTGQHLSPLQWSFMCWLKFSSVSSESPHLMQSTGQWSFCTSFSCSEISVEVAALPLLLVAAEEGSTSADMIFSLVAAADRLC